MTAGPPTPLPFYRRAHTLRQAFIAQLTDDDVQTIAAALIDRARKGDLKAAAFVLDRAIGTGPMSGWPTEQDLQLRDTLG